MGRRGVKGRGGARAVATEAAQAVEPVPATPAALAAALLAAVGEASGRGAAKRAAAALEALSAEEAGPVRAAVVALAAARGVALPEEAEGWPAKKLLRRALGRDAEAVAVGNPTARDEAFTCAHCGAEVPPAGRTARDHCPRCLYGQHVDVVPGDRAADCGGLLVPVGASFAAGRWVLEYRCARCGVTRRNQVITDVDVPDDPDAVARVASLGSVPSRAGR